MALDRLESGEGVTGSVMRLACLFLGDRSGGFMRALRDDARMVTLSTCAILAIVEMELTLVSPPCWLKTT